MTGTVGHPPGLPDLLLDRSLGSVQVPRILRAAGLRLQTLVDVYGSPADERIEDPEWLRLAGERGWVVFMKDQRIRYREVERAAVLDNRVRAFCLSSGNLRSAQRGCFAGRARGGDSPPSSSHYRDHGLFSEATEESP